MPSAGRLPCAARPCVTTSTQEKPLCVMATAMPVGSGITASSATHRFARTSAPRLAYSSSATAATITRPAPRRGPCSHRSAATIMAARPPFMSCAPRPYRRRSRRSGENGVVMPSTPTVSVWPQSIRVGPGAAPSAIATTFGLPAATSSTSTSKPACRRYVASQSAIAASPAAPGTSDGFTESMATSSRVSASGSITRIRLDYAEDSIRRLRRFRRFVSMPGRRLSLIGDGREAADVAGIFSSVSRKTTRFALDHSRKKNLRHRRNLRMNAPRNPAQIPAQSLTRTNRR